VIGVLGIFESKTNKIVDAVKIWDYSCMFKV
jgi:hypothetical protein